MTTPDNTFGIGEQYQFKLNKLFQCMEGESPDESVREYVTTNWGNIFEAILYFSGQNAEVTISIMMQMYDRRFQPKDGVELLQLLGKRLAEKQGTK